MSASIVGDNLFNGHIVYPRHTEHGYPNKKRLHPITLI